MRSLISLKFLPLSALALSGIFWIAACDSTVAPDEVVSVCVKGGVTQEITRKMRGIAERRRFLFTDNGADKKSELLRISADKSIIPAGLATNFHVKDDADVILMGTNFGSTGELLVLSFFGFDNNESYSQFSRDVLSEIATLPNAKVVAIRPDSDTQAIC